MITAGRYWQFYDPNRGYLMIDVRSAAFTPGSPIPAVERVFLWKPALEGDKWLRQTIDDFLDNPAGALAAEIPSMEAVPAPVCACCGHEALYYLQIGALAEGGVSYRCGKHEARNPCVIEGCMRSRMAKGYYSDEVFICGEHWRRYIPPGSPGRRALNRLAKLAKKLGYSRTARWPADLERRYWTLWTGLLRRAHRQSIEGRFDMTEVNKLFGWTDDD